MREIVFGTLLLVGCGDDVVKKQPDAKPIDAAVDGPIDAPPDAYVPDAYVLDGPVAMPVGMHHHYVVAKQYVALNSTGARMAGLDLNDDGTVDNQLGMVFGTLVGQGFDVEAANDRHVDRGESIILLDLQTESYLNATDAGVTTYDGADPTPAACTDANDLVCRHHLTGTASFAIAPPGVHEIPLVGDFVNGTMASSSGRLYTPIALLNERVALIGGRVQLTGASDAQVSGIIAGCIAKPDINGKIIPRMQQDIAALIARDCTNTNPNGSPPCGCADPSTGKQLQALFDTNPRDCQVTVDEVKDNGLIMSLLAPDLRIGGQDCLSFGMKFDAVGATFTP